MAATNTTAFNRFSSNIAEDGAIAVFDVLPNEGIKERDSAEPEEYRNDVAALRSAFSWLDPDARFFEIQSSHCSKRSSAYYLNRKGTRFTEFPSISGIPMNYGGAPLARYKALSRDIIGHEPFMLIPSMGMTTTYPDRARSFELWLNMEPYAQAARLNIFPDYIANLDLVTGAGQNYVTSGAGGVTRVQDGSEWDGASALRLTQEIDASTGLGFVSNTFSLNGGRRYKFSCALNGVKDTNVTIGFDVQLSGGLSKEYTRTIVLGADAIFDPSFGGDFVIGSDFAVGAWTEYSTDFIIDETLSEHITHLWIRVDNSVKISELSLVDNSSEVVETVIQEEPVIEFGGPDGTRVVISADVDFMYLRGYGQVSNFQVGEWARPMYLVCVDNDKTFDVYIDASPVMSIEKKDLSKTYGVVTGDWILMSLSESFKYMDLSTMSIYKGALGQDIQRIHYLFGYGPKYNDVIDRNSHETMYVADGSATSFSSGILFPQTTNFDIGISDGVTVSNELGLPDYEFPRLINGSYDDVEFFNLDTNGFGPQVFKFPENSEAVLVPSEIANDPEYLFIMVSPYNNPGGSLPESASNQSGLIAQITSATTDLECNIVYSDVGGGEILVSTTLSYPFGVKTYGEYRDASGYSAYNVDPGFQTITYLESAGEGVPFFSQKIARKNFLLALNLTELRGSLNADVAAVFNDPSIEYRFNDTCLYTYIAISTREAAFGNDIVPDPENDLPAVSIKSSAPFGGEGTVDTLILGRATYALYSSRSVDGEPTLDIAASGTWTTSLPLANFATFVNGSPDVDFIVYSDQGQSPQLVNSLEIDVMSYDEFQRFADSDLTTENAASPEGTTEYMDVWSYADKNLLSYRSMGLDVDTSEPTLGRLANRAIRTFVTLDSPLRWPNKEYSGLEIERIGLRGYIDFENSANSVLNTRWEIFDGFAIRVPKNINLYKYNLGFTVHLSTMSLKDRRPRFRRADFFGVASGDRPSNQISIGSGSYIVVGESEDINLGRPFSTHLTTETLPSNYMSRELGFYPHGYSDDNSVAPVYFYLTEDDRIKGISFYLHWRGETFRTVRDSSTGSLEDRIGYLKYLDKNNHEHYIDIGTETISPTTSPWLANLKTGYRFEGPLSAWSNTWGNNWEKEAKVPIEPKIWVDAGRPYTNLVSSSKAVGQGLPAINATGSGSVYTATSTSAMSARLQSSQLEVQEGTVYTLMSNLYAVGRKFATRIVYLDSNNVAIKSEYGNWVESGKVGESRLITVVPPRARNAHVYAAYSESTGTVGDKVTVSEFGFWEGSSGSWALPGEPIGTSRLIEAGKWHQVYIDLTDRGAIPLSDAGRSTVFAHTNEKAVLNYVTSHTVPIDETNLYAARFGLTDQSVFADDFSSDLHYGNFNSISIGTGDASVVVVHRPTAPTSSNDGPDDVAYIYLEDETADE